jgi:hypothetical protein
MTGSGHERTAGKRAAVAALACLLLVTAAALALSVFLLADEIDEKRRSPEHPKVELDDQTKQAIEKGLKYLASHQEKDGSWREMVGRKINDTYVGQVDKHVGVTALACLSFMAHGDFPGRGKYGDNVERGLEFILNCVDMNGYVVYGESRMYSHAFATLFLAEIYGMSPREDLGDKLRRAVNAIVKAQNAQNAWRYKPDSQDSDISVTVCQIMALRAARNAGVAVPVQTIKRGIEYVKKSAAPSGAFYYQIFNERGFQIMSRTSLALTAAGVATLQAAGEYDSAEAKRGVDYLYRSYVGAYRSRSTIEREMRYSFEFLYGQYYAVQAMYQAGGRVWAEYWDRLKTELVAFQFTDGRWQDVVGSNYATAMATLIMQIPLDYLPIFQR